MKRDAYVIGLLISEQGTLQRLPTVALSKQGFSHLSGWGQVKKLIRIKTKGIRITTMNIDTLMCKMMKLMNVMHRKKINVAFLQGTK